MKLLLSPTLLARLRSIGPSSFGFGGWLPGRQPRTPGTDPSFANEKFQKTEKPAKEDLTGIAVCGFLLLAGIFLGGIYDVANPTTDPNHYALEGGGGAAGVVCVAYLKPR